MIHRGLALLGTSRGADASVRYVGVLVDLSPDTGYRVDHSRGVARGFYSHGGWHRMREGGPYEIPPNDVIELDERGRIVRQDLYDDGTAPCGGGWLGVLAEDPAVIQAHPDVSLDPGEPVPGRVPPEGHDQWRCLRGIRLYRLHSA